MVGLDATVVVIANPYIASSLHCSLSDLQWVANAYLLSLAVLLVPMGKLGDRFGRRLIFLIGVTGFGLSSLAVGKVGSIGGVIAFRAVLGVFGAMLMPSTLTIIRAAFPKERLNLAVGIWGGAAAVWVAAGPVASGSSRPARVMGVVLFHQPAYCRHHARPGHGQARREQESPPRLGF